jgi:hypothetical protein
MDDDILTEWKSCLLTLPGEWNEKFLITASALDGIPASTAEMEIQKNLLLTQKHSTSRP